MKIKKIKKKWRRMRKYKRMKIGFDNPKLTHSSRPLVIRLQFGNPNNRRRKENAKGRSI